MRNYNFFRGTIFIVLCLLPMILLSNMNIIYENFIEIVCSLGILMGGTILLTLYNVIDESCFIIGKGSGEQYSQRAFFTVPILCIIFLSEMIIFYFMDTIFIKQHFGIFAGTISGIILAFVIYIILGGNYMPMRISRITKKDKKK